MTICRSAGQQAVHRESRLMRSLALALATLGPSAITRHPPASFTAGEAVELRALLAIAVMGGRCLSTVLVLLSMPAVLLLTARGKKVDPLAKVEDRAPYVPHVDQA